MLLQFIHVSSQSQPRMEPNGPVKAGAHLWVPHGSKDATATRLHHYRWLWPKCSGYQSSTAVRYGAAATAQSPSSQNERG